ncbi:MAG TPA: MBL fold metallo-hydrolase [Euzebyales bacterium]|nr:MBL fold metallo-hydrolase [Euzebyales bacterium]
MPARRRVDRRVFLSQAGRMGLGLMLSTSVVACATDAADEVGGQAPSSTPPPPPEASSPVASPQASAPSDRATPAALDWKRIDFGFVSAYLLVDNTQVVVVDSGVEGSEADIEEALTDLGMGWYAVEHVIFTHKHPDHIGSAAAILEATDADAHAGEGDHVSIVGPRPVSPVTDGQDIFGLQIITTPGHTPGHISVLDPGGGVLVVGDALVGPGDGGGVAGPDAAYTQDMDTAHESVRKLAGYRFDTLLFGHGEPVEQDAAGLVRELAAQL